MKFEEFSPEDAPTGKASTAWSEYPLMFGTQEEILEFVDAFSVIGDFMSDQGMDDFSAEFATRFADYRVIAACDVEEAMEQDPEFMFDSYAEFFLCVDVSKPQNPVLIWTGEEQFQPLFETFEQFFESLTDWTG